MEQGRKDGGSAEKNGKKRGVGAKSGDADSLSKGKIQAAVRAPFAKERSGVSESSRRRNSALYSGTFDLADTFESEENRHNKQVKQKERKKSRTVSEYFSSEGTFETGNAENLPNAENKNASGARRRGSQGRGGLSESFDAKKSGGERTNFTFDKNGGKPSETNKRNKNSKNSKNRKNSVKGGKVTEGESFDARVSYEKSEKAGKSDKSEKTGNAANTANVKNKKARQSAVGTEDRSPRSKSGGAEKKNKNGKVSKDNNKYSKENKKRNGKNSRAALAPLSQNDAAIKTRAQNGYIPFGTYDDDESYNSEYSDYPEYSEYSQELQNGTSPRAEEERAKAERSKESNASRENTEDDGNGGGSLSGTVVGRNAVRELLRSDRCIDKIYVKNGEREGSIVVIVAEAMSRRIPVIEVSSEKLDSLSGNLNHQGVVALAAEKQYTDIETILQIAKERGEKPLVVIADGIEDPQNLGALIRCAECAGAHGIIIPKRRAVGLTPTVTRSSAGAVEHMAVAKVSNLADAVEKLKKAGLWIFAAEAGGVPYYEADFNVPAAVILGSEGFGVARLLRERADYTVSIPMYGHVNSLNVSSAAAVILCHAARMQRS